MRSAGGETDRSTFTLTTLYRMLDHRYTDLSTCKELHGDPGQSTRNAAADPPLRADHLAVHGAQAEDRKSTRLNSRHRCISYAIFCLKKKNTANHRLDLWYKCHRTRPLLP